MQRPQHHSEKTASDVPPVLTSRSDSTLDVVLNRPDQRNAVSIALRDGLCGALNLALVDSSIRSINLSGAGSCFSIGGILEEFGTVTDPVSGHTIRSLRAPARFLAACADRLHVKVHSACIGAGVEFMAFARSTTAAPNSFFQLPELEMGLIPGAGGCVSLPRRIGRQLTALMVFSGRRINARTALAWGLIDKIEEPTG
jgi:enoyl-CoA hydratase/carnithine racemase